MPEEIKNDYPKKISDRKNTQMHMKRRLHTQRKKLRDKKRESPLSPGMRESVNLLPKYFRHQPKKGDCTKFVYKDNKKTSEKRDPTNPFAGHLGLSYRQLLASRDT